MPREIRAELLFSRKGWQRIPVSEEGVSKHSTPAVNLKSRTDTKTRVGLFRGS